MVGISCDCQCPKLLSKPYEVLQDGHVDILESGPVVASDGPQKIDGDGFGVSLVGNFNATGAVSCVIDGISQDSVSASASLNSETTPVHFSALNPVRTLSLNGQSRNIIQERGGMSLSVASCAVGDQVLVTASAPCLLNDVVATPLSVTRNKNVGTVGNVLTVGPMPQRINNDPPTGVFGNYASAFTLYRDGSQIASFESPVIGDYTLQFINIDGDNGPEVSGAGSYLEPMTLNGQTGKQWNVKVRPSKSGVLVLRWKGKFWGFSPSGWYVMNGGDGEGILVTANVQGGQDLLLNLAGGDATFTNRGLPDDASWKVDVPLMYLLPFMEEHAFPESVKSQLGQPGSYLLVAEHKGQAAGERLACTKPTPMRSYSSWVLHAEKYAAAATQIDDFWDDAPPPPVEYAVTDGGLRTTLYRENPFVEFVKLNCDFTSSPDGFVPWLWLPGSYTARARFVDNQDAFDVYGNAPLTTSPNIAFTRHAVPANGKRGAASHFAPDRGTWSFAQNTFLISTSKNPGTLPQEGGDRGLIRKQPLKTIDIFFDKAVTGITASMFSVSGNVPPSGASASLPIASVKRATGSLSHYVVTLSIGEQIPDSQWTITFTPTGDVGTFATVPVVDVTGLPPQPWQIGVVYRRSDGYLMWNGQSTAYYGFFYVPYPPAAVTAEPYQSLQSFPTTGKTGVVYLADDTGDDYVWAGGEYRRPTAEDCDEWGTTKLACRYMWAMAKDNAVSRHLIDTSADSDTTMPSRVSISAAITPASDSSKMSTTVQATENAVIDRAKSVQQLYLADEGQTDFIPRMPDDVTTETTGRFGYFGVPTTIYPAKAAMVGDCSAPSTPQRHASLLFGADDVSSLTITSPNGWTVTASSSSMPQNFWKGSANPGTETNTEITQSRDNLGRISKETDNKISLDEVTASVRAVRGRLTYNALQTTSVTELVFEIATGSITSQYQRTRDFTAINAIESQPGEWTAWSKVGTTTFPIGLAARVVVPTSSELSLGQLRDTSGNKWTITKG